VGVVWGDEGEVKVTLERVDGGRREKALMCRCPVVWTKVVKAQQRPAHPPDPGEHTCLLCLPFSSPRTPDYTPQAAVVQAAAAPLRHQVHRDVRGAVRRPRAMRVG